MPIKDNYITVDNSPSKDKSVIDIPYADYIVRITTSNDVTYDIFKEGIQILRRVEEGSLKLEDVTGELIVKFDYTTKIRPTGDNLLKILALIFHETNEH